MKCFNTCDFTYITLCVNNMNNQVHMYWNKERDKLGFFLDLCSLKACLCYPFCIHAISNFTKLLVSGHQHDFFSSRDKCTILQDTQVTTSLHSYEFIL